MTSLLKAKIAAAKSDGPEAEGLPVGVENLFAPLQKLLCDSLKALSSQDCDAGVIEVTAVSTESRAALLQLPSLKLAFNIDAETFQGMGHYSANLVGHITRSALHIPSENSAALEDYSPTKLDALLLRPVTESIKTSLAALFLQEAQLLAGCAPSFEALKFGKSQLKNMGELSQVTIFVTPATSADDEETSKATPAGDTASPFFLRLYLPTQKLIKLSPIGLNDSSNNAPILDPEHPWTAHMRQSIRTADVPIRAVVESCHMTIAECTRLEIGQVISLPGVSLNAVGLLIDMDADETSPQPPIEIARGSLGIFKKNRALKLTEDIDPAFTHDLDYITV